MSDHIQLFKNNIGAIQDFPKPGILFRDVTPLLQNPPVFQQLIDFWAERYSKDKKPDHFIGIESRGFIFATALSLKLNVPLTLVRKPGKLPGKVISYAYELEYGKDSLEIKQDALEPGEKVIIIDDLLATGGTAGATVKLVEQCGVSVVECAFVIELTDLRGNHNITAPCFSILQYE